MRILFTGASGAAARLLAESITRDDRKYKIYGVGRRPKEQIQAPFDEYFQIDLSNSYAAAKFFNTEGPFDYIYNFASNADVKFSFENPAQVINDNILSSVGLFEGLKNCGCLSTRVIHISTPEVYGSNPSGDILSEDSVTFPRNPYAISKLSQEHIALYYYKSYSIPVLITRMFTYVNPYRYNIFTSAFARQIVQIERGERDLLIHGNLSSRRSIIGPEDAVEAYLSVLELPFDGAIYNISGDEYMHVGDVLEILKKAAKCKILAKHVGGLVRPTDIESQIADSNRFRSATGWRPKQSVEMALRSLLNHYRGN